MKTFKALAKGDTLYIYFIDSIIEFLITKVQKYPGNAGIRFSGLVKDVSNEISWNVLTKDINSTLTKDTATTIELAQQGQSKLIYKRNTVRRVQGRHLRTALIT